MNDEDVKRIIDDADDYDEAREDSLLRIAGEFYSRRMSSVTAAAWVNSLVALAVAVACAVRFFRTDLVKDEILYAVVFLTAIMWISAVKTFAWMEISRKRIARDIKRLEIRLLASGDAGRKQPGPGGLT
jgi:hypothetical protein